MNAAARTPRYGPPTATLAASQAEHDRMARNRLGVPLALNPVPDEDPLTRPAFTEAKLLRDVQDARDALDRARVARTLGKSKNEKQRLGRAVSASGKALTVAEQALAAERRAAPYAEAVQRQAVVSDTGTVLRDPRIVVSSGKRAELQRALEWLLKRNTIDEKAYRAARRYRNAWERAGRDAYPIGLGGGAGGRSAPQSGNRRVEEAAASSADLSGARRAIGVFGSGMLEHIVVHDLSLDAWAEKQGVSNHVAKGVLIMVLERLAEHWVSVTPQDAP